MIVIEHASKSFGPTRAVDDLSFALEPGQMTGLLGPNGAGKTTTIRMIAGYLAPDAGSITLAGHPVRTSPAIARRSLGYLPESAPLYPELKPAQYLDYRARLFAMPRRERRAAVARVIDRCRLADMAHKRIGVLSKGYRQRVGLAAAIVHDPPVLILDEPTNGLDPAQMRTTRALISELAERRTVLLCTHVIPEVERSCARVLVIAAGTLVADGPPDRIGARTTAIHLETTPDDPALRARVADALGPRATVAPRPGAPEGWARFAVTPDPAFTGDAQAALARALAGAARPVRHLADAAAPLEERVVELIDRAGATPADEQHPDGSAP
jgi:ABC-2 type transport system ATP-binding protein